MVEGFTQVVSDLVGQVGVDAGGCDASMPQDPLDDADVDSTFKEMSCKGVTQGMNGCLLVDTTLKESSFESMLHRGDVDMLSVSSRKEPILCPGFTPEFS